MSSATDYSQLVCYAHFLRGPGTLPGLEKDNAQAKALAQSTCTELAFELTVIDSTPCHSRHGANYMSRTLARYVASSV